jgi:hypothetical protein
VTAARGSEERDAPAANRPPDLNPNQEGFGDVRRGDQHAAAARSARRERDGQHAPHGPHRPIERELADEDDIAGGRGAEASIRREDRCRDGKVERRSLLADIGRGEIDRDAALRQQIPNA